MPSTDKNSAPSAIRKMLNVGGGSKTIPIPAIYSGWEHVLLDIDPKGKPDVVCDARNLTTLPPKTYDAVYCSHNLEHYYAHEVKDVLKGMAHVVKDSGFVHIRVPDIEELMKRVLERNLDMDEAVYTTASAGPITVQDILYGWGKEIEESGQHFYAHKTGFTPRFLRKKLHEAGFRYVFGASSNLEVIAVALKNPPTGDVVKYFGLPEEVSAFES